MRSRLFHAVVGVGISLGTLNGGCLGRAASDEPRSGPEGFEPSSDPPEHQDGGTGDSASSVGNATGSGQSTGSPDASSTAGGGPGSGGSASETSTTAIGADGNPLPPDPPDGGAGGQGGATGDTETATSSEAPDDPVFDPFCDAAWPTTKGHPYPPDCVDPNHECDDAGFPSYCVQVFDDGSCGGQTQSPFCVNAEWQCAPGLADLSECHCWGPLEEGLTCGENGVEPQDG